MRKEEKTISWKLLVLNIHRRTKIDTKLYERPQNGNISTITITFSAQLIFVVCLS